MRIIRIGTRGSKLALWQANDLKDKLTSIGLDSELHIIKTTGDINQHSNFAEAGTIGLFTKEIEAALLKGDIDIAVHSLKDLPVDQNSGLRIAAVSSRAKVNDVLIIKEEAFDASQPFKLKENAVVGTSALRRRFQLLSFRPDLQIEGLRGNIPSRIQKLASENYDAIMLAAAGLERLGSDLDDYKVIPLHPREFVSAPGQGVIAYQISRKNTELYNDLQRINNIEAAVRTNIERKIMHQLEGGCRKPIGVYCEKDALNNYHVWVYYSDEEGTKSIRVNYSSSTYSDIADVVVEQVKEQL